MDQVISVIGQNPLRVCEAFHAHRIFTAPFKLLADLFNDGLNLFGVVSAADHEKVRERGYVAQIQYTNVEGFL